jgi:cysteinyl-tRNA synthetase
VLRLYDPRTRTVEDARPAHGRELRILAVAPAAGATPHLGLWRTWLLPDLIFRCAERRGLIATTCEITVPASGDGDTGGAGETSGAADLGAQAAAQAAAPRADREVLNIHPPTRIAPVAEPVERTVEFVTAGRPGQAAEGPPFDIGIGIGIGIGGGDGLAGRELARLVTAPAGAVTMDGRKVTADDADAPAVEDIAARGLDPLAVRLVFLSRPYREDADLSWETLFTAGTTLLRWRERVAEWANSPSGAMPRRYVDAVTEAFDDDLDTPRALRELQALEADGSVPDGAKFEAFAAMDRLFGLDLARDVGR